MPQESQVPTQNEEDTDVYDNRSYNLWISFNNCTITNLHIEQYGKPVNPPPKIGE